MRRAKFDGRGFCRTLIPVRHPKGWAMKMDFVSYLLAFFALCITYTVAIASLIMWLSSKLNAINLRLLKIEIKIGIEDKE